jgi:23S rRNA (cytosine1962-C5)-methyltransferase
VIKIRLKKGPWDVLSGHPWVYKSQIETVEGTPEPGILCEIHAGPRLVGVGYYNERSQIAARVLARSKVSIDRAFFVARIRRALEHRERVVRDTDAYRLIFSEADALPGLIIDRYAGTCVVQFLTAGMERLREDVLGALDEVLPSTGVYEKSDSSSRKIEGLEPRSGWLARSCGDEVTVHERGVRFPVRFGEGHKTGFYLDQRDNRYILADLGLKGEALDVFCYEGGFGLHLAKAGMAVTGVDIQPETIRRAEETRRLNGLDETNLAFRAADAFEEMRNLEKEGRRFDLVVLDPPSFVKRKSELEGAIKGFKEILLRGFRLLKDGGHLAVFSCSYHMDENLLMQVALGAALDTKKSLRLLRFLKQSGDHPIDPFAPETYYLKGYLFQVSQGL